MNYDLEQIREKFPALNIKDSGVRRIYFDNPAGTQVPIEVIEAVQKCMIESNANIQGGFETSNRADKILDEFHQSMQPHFLYLCSKIIFLIYQGDSNWVFCYQ